MFPDYLILFLGLKSALWNEQSLLKVTFIGLAALTVPHMLLVDLYPRIRTTSF